jgi:hypothetical protein
MSALQKKAFPYPDEFWRIGYFDASKKTWVKAWVIPADHRFFIVEFYRHRFRADIVAEAALLSEEDRDSSFQERGRNCGSTGIERRPCKLPIRSGSCAFHSSTQTLSSATSRHSVPTRHQATAPPLPPAPPPATQSRTPQESQPAAPHNPPRSARVCWHRE